MGPRVEQLDLDGSTEQVALDGIAAHRGELFELGVPVGALCAYPQAEAVCGFDDQSHQHRVGRLDSDAADEGFVDLPQSSGRCRNPASEDVPAPKPSAANRTPTSRKAFSTATSSSLSVLMLGSPTSMDN